MPKLYSDTSVFSSQNFQKEMLSSSSGFVFLNFHHCRSPFPLNAHDHVGVVTAYVTVEDVSVRIDEMVMVLQTKMFEDFVHWSRFRTVEFRALYRFVRANFLVVSSILKLEKFFSFQMKDIDSIKDGRKGEFSMNIMLILDERSTLLVEWHERKL